MHDSDFKKTISIYPILPPTQIEDLEIGQVELLCLHAELCAWDGLISHVCSWHVKPRVSPHLSVLVIVITYTYRPYYLKLWPYEHLINKYIWIQFSSAYPIKDQGGGARSKLIRAITGNSLEVGSIYRIPHLHNIHVIGLWEEADRSHVDTVKTGKSHTERPQVASESEPLFLAMRHYNTLLLSHNI